MMSLDGPNLNLAPNLVLSFCSLCITKLVENGEKKRWERGGEEKGGRGGFGSLEWIVLQNKKFAHHPLLRSNPSKS
jgi:hypothetical protein